MERHGYTEVVRMQDLRSRKAHSISCCMIARDEAEFIGAALESVKELADEIIVVDTGSVDETIAVAEEHGAKVFRARWNDDFSAARNVSIERATREWILVLDADEALSPADHGRIRELVKSHPDASFMFDQWTYTDDSSTLGWKPLERHDAMNGGESGYFSSRQVRLFRNAEGIRYVGRVHENPEASIIVKGAPIHTADVVVHHYGRIEGSERVYRKYLMYTAPGEKGVEASPNNTQYIYEMAVQLLTLDRVEDAIEHIEKGIEVEPAVWQFHNIMGLANLRLGRRSEAVDNLRTARDLSQDAPEVYNNLGAALLENDLPAEALEVLERGLEIEADHASILRNAASAALKLDLIDRASEYIVRSLNGDPFMSQSHVIRAEIQYMRNDHEGSLESLGRIRFLDRLPLKVYIKAIHLYTQMQRLREAGEVLERAASEHPGYKGLLFLRGKLHEMGGETAKAISVFQELLALDPGNADVYNSLGCAHERNGDLRKALEAFRHGSALSPRNLQIRVNLGIVLGKLGHNDDAEVCLRRVLDDKEDYGMAHNALACHLASHGMYREAIPHFTRSIELEPDNINYHLNLGLLFERLDLPARAAEVYEKIAAVAPQTVPLIEGRLEKLRDSVAT